MGRFHRHPDGTVHVHDHDGDHDDGGDGQDRHGHRDVGDHSGYETGTERVQILETILDENDRIAQRNRDDLAEHRVRMVNLMSSPGAGKTSLLRRAIPELAASGVRVGVLEGDIATSIDADALADVGTAAIALVNTDAGFGGECHLDAVMVRSGLSRLPLSELDVVLIENVGNLVCPAEFDVGQDRRAMVYAITEGEEKPLKYPVMFHAVDAVFVNKIDLLPHLDFDLDAFYEHLRQVNPTVEVVEVSARTGDGVDRVAEWLRP
ncbi:MAG: hydrogenase nickel incorporation protein HypB [Ilumatobacter sp.]|uniref:hydrogenase nickel incorporation protein HypB n=1 Tax=Ilumatobacter sp. TaxID=1967498 RepID=UPI002632FD04|nr:hydrogenase nickel incorporation protein HypB [Ilumatobacter sp.]MDJ0769858.1 hydrogenase nickel incorporation protein HypB [Ilumatobacter sp.]